MEQTYYYGVVYFDNGEALISKPYESLENLMEDMKRGVAKQIEHVTATSYITRKEKLTTQQILGCPNSRNIMKDKKYIKSITA